MKRKQQFLRAVKILAPNDSFIHRLAQCVPEDTLPLQPGGAALEFVVEMERLKTSVPLTKTTFPTPSPRRRRLGPTCSARTTRCEPETAQGELGLKDAMRVKSAEYWLKLGQPAQALRELEALPKSVQRFPWAMKVHLAAVHAAGQGYIARAE